jgi:hypothetical protein
MTSQLFHVLRISSGFPARGVATGIQRAVAAARETGYRLAGADHLEGVEGAGHNVDRTFPARRRHIVRREALRRAARVSGPSGSV